jgi:two-component system response regulator
MSEKILLLIEDNPNDEALTLRALRKHHIANRAVVVRDGAEALDWLFVRGQHAGRDVALRPQVVLLDLNLPKLSGIDVLRAIRDNPATRQIPVVILTSSKEDKDLVETYRLGANGYVCKPVSFNEFNEAVNKLGLYWLLLNEAPPT